MRLRVRPRHERNRRTCLARSLDRCWRHSCDGSLGRRAQAVWSAVSKSGLLGALDRSPSPRALEAPKHRARDAGSRRIVDRMVCALRDRYDLLGALAVDVRSWVGSIADFAPRPVHRDRHGSGTIAHLAAGDGRRDRIQEDGKAGLQLHQEPRHSHGLRPRHVPHRTRNGLAPLRQVRVPLRVSTHTERHDGVREQVKPRTV